MSVSWSLPITCARRLRPSDSLTVMRSAWSTTCWFVRMLPSASMMKPVPAPRRVGSARPLSSRSLSRLRGGRSNGESNVSGGGASVRLRRRRESRALVEASMLTTAGLMRSTTSAKLTVPAGSAAFATAAGALPAFFTSGPATISDRLMPPATMVPTRNATAAVSVRVTIVKRRDIYLSIIRARKRSSSRVSTPSFLAFSNFVPASVPATT